MVRLTTMNWRSHRTCYSEQYLIAFIISRVLFTVTLILSLSMGRLTWWFQFSIDEGVKQYVQNAAKNAQDMTICLLDDLHLFLSGTYQFILNMLCVGLNVQLTGSLSNSSPGLMANITPPPHSDCFYLNGLVC